MSDPTGPVIISMSVDDEDDWESEYRVRIGSRVKYLTIAPATFDRETLSFPLASLPPLPYQDDTWTTAHVSRDAESGELKTRLDQNPLAGVRSTWHGTRINVLDLEQTERLTGTASEALVSRSAVPSLGEPPSASSDDKVAVIVKFARFEWEIRRIEQETRAYYLLQQHGASDMAPRFVGHVHESGRVMGLMLEKLDGRRNASIEDLSACEAVLARFHGLGYLHGDPNRYNFLVGHGGGGEVKLIDFENFQEDASEDERKNEVQSLRENLVDTSGRGASFRFIGDEE